MKAALAEKLRIVQALNATRWNCKASAEALDMPRRTFYRKMAGHGIQAAPQDLPS